ncbi:MAG: GC-type dockerin domain-anchored protein [Phycisphaerales bacterium]
MNARAFRRSGSQIARLISIAGLASGLAASSAHAQTLNWSNGAGGSAATITNWSPNQLPNASSLLVWNLPNTYSVTWNASVAASNTHTLKKGAVTYSLSAPHAIGAGGLKVGDVSGDAATLTLTTGSLNSAGPTIIGNASGSSGILNVNDDDAELILTGLAGDLTVGANAPGTLNLTGGGLVQVAHHFVGGSNAASTSAITVSGATTTLPLVRSRLLVSGGGSPSKFGGGGDATVSISNGALAQFANDLAVSFGSASTSSVTVAGQGGIVPTKAELAVQGDLLLSRNISGGSAAGAATFNVNADGVATVGGTLFVAGDPDGGSAVLHTATGGVVTAHSLDLGVGSTLDLDGGELFIDAGTLTNSLGTTLDINGAPGNPVVTMKNGATATLPAFSNAGLRIGTGSGANLADFDVRSGSDLVVNGNLLMGVGNDDFGGMIVSGAGSTLSNPGSIVIAGIAGDARLEAEMGADISGHELWVARDATSTADVLFENPGTTAQFDAVYIGGSSTAGGGNGQLVVNAQAVLTSGPLKVWVGGKLDVTQSAVVNLTGGADLTVLGEAQLDDGAVVSADFAEFRFGSILRGPNAVAGASTLNAKTHLLSGATLVLAAGDLTVGDESSTLGFLAGDGSVINVGAHTLTLLDADLAEVDDITINGGEIIAPNGFEIVTPGQDGRLDGTGTITGEVFIESGGSVITSTGANGITINGRFRNHSGNIDGTRYTFNHNPNMPGDSGWSGAGAINARVTFNTNTTVMALANMTMGANTTDGVVFNAGTTLDVNEEIVTLVDSNGVALASVNRLAVGGIIQSSSNLSLTTDRTIVGTGEIVCPTFNMTGGSVSPSARTGSSDPIGSLTFDPASAFVMSDTTHSHVSYDCDIAGLTNADHLRVEGAATLDGTLNVRLVNGFVMPRASRVDVASITGPLTGWFTTLNLPWGHRLVEFFTDETVLQVFNCPPDVNSDGFVNGDDYDAFASAFESGDGFADFNEDGFVNGDDYDMFASEFEMGC